MLAANSAGNTSACQGDKPLAASAAREAGVPIVTGDTKVVERGKAAMVKTAGSHIRVMRDPTRGGLAATLNELAQQSKVGFRIEEEAIPVRPEVAAACELLGLDPLNVANEGKLVAIVAPEATSGLLAAMRAHPLGRDAVDIGQVVEDDHCFVQMTTSFGGGRIVDWLSGEQLPRIC
jgi:hydrogenase expression/formation protein HypE